MIDEVKCDECGAVIDCECMTYNECYAGIYTLNVRNLSDGPLGRNTPLVYEKQPKL